MRYPRLLKNTPYHIYNRGVSKNELFKQPEDYMYFVYKMKKLQRRFSIHIKPFCLIPNHFHFLLTSLKSVKNLSIFMKILQQTYAQYFNAKYKHSGHVFQGPYKHNPLKTAKSVANATNYIKNNSVKHKVVKKSENWPYQG